MVFSEYNFEDTVLPGSYNPNTAEDASQNTTDSSGIECVGAACCTSNQLYRMPRPGHTGNAFDHQCYAFSRNGTVRTTSVTGQSQPRVL